MCSLCLRILTRAVQGSRFKGLVGHAKNALVKDFPNPEPGTFEPYLTLSAKHWLRSSDNRKEDGQKAGQRIDGAAAAAKTRSFKFKGRLFFINPVVFGGLL